MEYKVETFDKRYDLIRAVTLALLDSGYGQLVFKEASTLANSAREIRHMVDELLKEDGQ